MRSIRRSGVFASVADGVGNDELKAGIPMMKQALADFVNEPDDNLDDTDLASMAAALDLRSDVDSQDIDVQGIEQQALSERDITRDFLKLIY